MKMKILALVALLMGAYVVSAQMPATKDLTGSTCPGTGCLTLDVGGYAGVSVQLSGTWVGTVTFEACTGFTCTTFQPISLTASSSNAVTSTATANGMWFGSLGGARYLQVRFSTPTSGSPHVAIGVSASSSALRQVTAPSPPIPPTPPAPSGGLLQQSDLTFVGYFRCASAPVNQCAGPDPTLDFAGSGIAMSVSGTVSGNALVAFGHNNSATEFSIPTPVNSSTLSALPRATSLQGFGDPFGGNLSDVTVGISPNTAAGGGFLAYNGGYVITAYPFYDSANVATVSHFIKTGSTFSVTDTSHAYKIGAQPSTLKAGFVSGYMAPIPAAYQTLLGGDALTGNAEVNIIGRTSLGPAASVITLSTIGIVIPAPATTVVAYPTSHPTLGSCNTSGTHANCVSHIGGMVFPTGTRSILFFGSLATGTVNYGFGTSNPALDGTPGTACGDSSVNLWYDLAFPGCGNKGYHGYPYEYFVLAYDVNDFIDVKNSVKQPWDILPYSTWAMTPSIPGTSFLNQYTGAAYDAVHNRIILTQWEADGTNPLFAVYQLP